MAKGRGWMIGTVLAAAGVAGGVSAGIFPPGVFHLVNCPVEPSTGRIAYRQMQGPMITEKTMVWADHGRRYREDTDALIVGRHRLPDKDTWTLCDGAAVYESEHMAGKYYRRIPPGEMAELDNPFILARLPSSVIGSQRLQGRVCEVRRVGHSRVWVWKGVVLKIDGSSPGGPADQLVAVRLQTPARIAPKLFRVPAGFRLLPR